jgi:LemA protein
MPTIVYFGIVLVVIVLWFIATYNGFIGLRNRVEEAFSTMDVYLKKRYDLIPNIVETVKGYASHEKDTLEAVINARSKAVNAQGVENKLEAEQGLTGALSKLMVLAESYPELKANVNFMDLQEQLKLMEGEIANARKYYNGVVKLFNIKVESIPSNFVAMLCGFKRQPMFEITDEVQRENVKVQF